MNRKRIEAVLFDLGETLLVFGRIDRKRILEEAIRASYDYLKELKQPVGSFGAYRLFHSWGIRWKVFRSWQTGTDFDSLGLLKTFGQKKGYTLTDAQWEELGWRWYMGLAKQGCVKEGTAEALHRLSDMDVKLGLLSNTFIHRSSLERHMAQEGLLDYLPVRVYSYELARRKPWAAAFEQTAAAVGVAPERIAYVGDRLDNDVEGALRVGMTPVLIRAYTNETKRIPPGLLCINSIAELPDLIERLNLEAVRV